MKVFISWSGSVSHEVAMALRDWLPNVLQAIQPYVSSEDIDKGARWSTDISQELQESSFGIICVTAENLEAPWVNFEAGALSKSLDRSRVAPFLYGVDRTAVQGPLLQFQSTLVQQDDVKKLVQSLNQACGEHALPDGRLDEIFEVWWPRLQARMDAIDSTGASHSRTHERSTKDLVTEVLELVRGQQKLLASPDVLFPPDYVRELSRVIRPVAGAREFRDLDERWTVLLSITRREDIPGPVADALARLAEPVDYIVARYSRREPYRRARRPSGFAGRIEPTVETAERVETAEESED